MIVKIGLSILSLVLGYLYLTQEPEIIDRTQHFQNKVDSLEVVLMTKDRMIENRDMKISDLNNDFDSLHRYQNKMYVYYENQKSNIINVPDSAVLSTFTGLLGNR